MSLSAWWNAPADCAAFVARLLPRFRWLARDWRAVVAQMERVGVRAVGLAFFTGFCTGAIVAWQGAYQVRGLAPVSLLSGQIVKVLCMEVGPVLTALVLAGRIGAGLAAELGAMRVTEQIDALRSLSIDPLRYLVAPRVAGGTLMFPALTLFAAVAGVGGALAALAVGEGVSVARFAASVRQQVEADDVALGLSKSLLFGFLITSLGCWQGLNARGGAEGVSRAAVGAFVSAAVAVLGADFLLWALIL